MVIFRENSEDIYAGIEYEAESDKAKKLIKFLHEEMGVKKIRFPEHLGHRHQAGRRSKAPSAWCARPSSTPSTTTSPA